MAWLAASMRMRFSRSLRVYMSDSCPRPRTVFLLLRNVYGFTLGDTFYRTAGLLDCITDNADDLVKEILRFRRHH